LIVVVVGCWHPQCEERLSKRDADVKDREAQVAELEKAGEAATSRWRQVVDKKMLNEEALRQGG
jgi:hypothetical protein